MPPFERNRRRDSSSVTSKDATPEDPWSDDNFCEMSALWKLTEEEEQNVRELQVILADVDHWKNDPFEVVRYYREYRTVAKAEYMFRRMVEWRVSNNMDSLLAEYSPPRLFHYLPTFLCQGLDRDGDPIYCERTGAGDPYGLVVDHCMEALADYTGYIREMTTARRRSPGFCWQRDYYEPLVGRRMSQFTVIMDMQGLNPRHLKGGLLGLLKRMARISQDYYAGMAKRIIMLRAPAIFQWGWTTVVQHFFDEHIRKLIVFTNVDDYLEVLDQYVDLKVLPECLAPGHGTGKAMPGYFQQIHLEGGMIPKDENYVPAVVEREDDSKPQFTRSSSVVSAGSIMKGVWEEEDPLDDRSLHRRASQQRILIESCHSKYKC